MVHIHILSATDRPNSNALKVAQYVEGYLKEKADTDLFSLRDFPVRDVAGGKYNDKPASVQQFNSEFLEADGFLFVIPEYNGGFPGILKLFFDYLPFPESFNKKPVCLIGEADGAFGALRPVEQFSQLLVYRKAYIYPDRLFIQRVNDVFDEKEGFTSEKMQKLMENQMRGFPDFVEQVKLDLIQA